MVFELPLTQQVILINSRRAKGHLAVGMVVGRSDHIDQKDQYLVRFVDGQGDPKEDWFFETELLKYTATNVTEETEETE